MLQGCIFRDVCVWVWTVSIQVLVTTVAHCMKLQSPQVLPAEAVLIFAFLHCDLLTFQPNPVCVCVCVCGLRCFGLVCDRHPFQCVHYIAFTAVFCHESCGWTVSCQKENHMKVTGRLIKCNSNLKVYSVSQQSSCVAFVVFFAASLHRQITECGSCSATPRPQGVVWSTTNITCAKFIISAAVVSQDI